MIISLLVRNPIAPVLLILRKSATTRMVAEMVMFLINNKTVMVLGKILPT